MRTLLAAVLSAFVGMAVGAAVVFPALSERNDHRADSSLLRHAADEQTTAAHAGRSAPETEDRPGAGVPLAFASQLGGRLIESTGTAPAAADPVTGFLDPLGEAEYSQEERIAMAVYENVNRSVVNISTNTVQTDAFFMFEIPSRGEGSGTVLDKRGHILTNFHVLEGAREVQVTLFDGATYEARIVGVDPTTDVAVLRIDAPAESLHPAVLGDSSRLRVGQRVYAIGNPFGLERTLSTGTIASLNRSLPSQRPYRKITQVVQIDAAINPGSSGGPLLDSHSRMIGMNTAIASRTGESAGVGFAIPANTIARVVPQLIEHGRVIRADIGIVRVYQVEQGLLIAALAPGGAAEQAGLRGPQVVRRRRQLGATIYEYQAIDRSAADLIVAVDGQPIRSVEDFLTIVESKSPNDQVVVTVIRQGKRVDVPVKLTAGS